MTEQPTGPIAQPSIRPTRPTQDPIQKPIQNPTPKPVGNQPMQPLRKPVIAPEAPQTPQMPEQPAKTPGMLELLERIETLQQRLQQGDMQAYGQECSALATLRQSIEKNKFTVAVVGEFSRGKSTFVNALIRQELLPMDVLPETALLQVVEYAPETSVELVYKDGRREPIAADRESLERFSIDGAEAQREDIACLHIGCPSYLLKKNITLIDTPGVMDMEDQRADITYGVLPQADMVLFLLDATSPLKKTEYEFIEKQILPQGITSFVFLANKADNIDEEEDEDFPEALQKRLEKAFLLKEPKESQAGKPGLPEIKLFPLSAKWALDGYAKQDSKKIEASGIRKLEEYLHDALQSEKRDETLLRRFRWKYGQTVKRLTHAIALERNLKLASAEELEAARQQVETLLQGHAGHRQQIGQYVQEQLAVIDRMIEKSLHFSHDRLLEDVEAAVMDYRGTDFQHFVESNLSHKVQREIDAWLSINTQRIAILLRKVEDELAKGLVRKFNDALHVGSAYTDATTPAEAQQKYIIELTADDISDTDVVSGAIAAVGGIGLGLLVSSIFLPFLSIAAWPIIRSSMLQHRLAKAQQEVMPEIEKSLAACYTQIQNDMKQSLAKQGAKMAERFDEIYQLKLKALKQQIEAEQREKAERREADLTAAKQCADQLAFLEKLSY